LLSAPLKLHVHEDLASFEFDLDIGGLEAMHAPAER
jgi:hypothetical protein